MRRRPWLEIGVLIAIIALVGLWAFPFRSEPSPVASASASPAGPSPRPDVQWQATWEDELVFRDNARHNMFGDWSYSSETLYAERDRFRLVETTSKGTRLVGTGTLRRRGDRLELRGMRIRRTYRLRGRAGHWALDAVDPRGPRLDQITMPERHLRPTLEWLRPGGRLGILGVRPGSEMSEVRRKFGTPHATTISWSRPEGLAFSIGKVADALIVAPDRNGRVYQVEGYTLEQDGRPLLNSRSTLADLESLFGYLPAPVPSDKWSARYDWPRLGVTVVVAHFPDRAPTLDAAVIISIRLSPPR